MTKRKDRVQYLAYHGPRPLKITKPSPKQPSLPPELVLLVLERLNEDQPNQYPINNRRLFRRICKAWASLISPWKTVSFNQDNILRILVRIEDPRLAIDQDARLRLKHAHFGFGKGGANAGDIYAGIERVIELCPNLEEFYFTAGLNGHILFTLEIAKSLSRLRNLRLLSFDYGRQLPPVTDQILARVLLHAPELRTLTFEYGHLRIARSLNNFFATNTKLHTLKMHACTYTASGDDKYMGWFDNPVPSLRVLDIENETIYKAGDTRRELFERIVNFAPGVTDLRAWGCCQISHDLDLDPTSPRQDAVLARLSNLRTLKTDVLTVRSWAGLVRSLPQLNHLSVYHCCSWNQVPQLIGWKDAFEMVKLFPRGGYISLPNSARAKWRKAKKDEFNEMCAAKDIKIEW